MSAEPSKDDAKSKAGEKQDELPLPGMSLGKRVGKTPAPPSENNGENPQQETWQQRHSRTEIWIQKAILVFAVIACWVYYGQLKEMRNATNEATKATNIAQQSLRLDERAWISVKPVSIALEPGKEFVITLQLENIGKTPAKSVQSYNAYQYAQTVSGTGQVIITPTAKIATALTGPDFTGEDDLMKQMTPTIINPGIPAIEEVHSGPVILDKAAVDKVNSGTNKIFVYGKITYIDNFKVPHWLTFCMEYDPKIPGFALWNTHNDCDDNE